MGWFARGFDGQCEFDLISNHFGSDNILRAGKQCG